MRLRPLKIQDAPLMLEWMHDDVVKNLQANFKAKTLADCEAFILACADTPQNLHLAIVDKKDEYMGTVSLKYISADEKSAEFAITVRSCAMGKGYSAYGMREIIRVGLEELGLDCVYWCVSPDNVRAVSFYDKHEYGRVDSDTVKPKGYSQEQIESYIWYAVTK